MSQHDMDWIENVEDIVDEDSGEPLLDQFFGDEDELTHMIDRFLSEKPDPHKNVIDRILDILVKCLQTTCKNSIEDTWTRSSITPKRQNATRTLQLLMMNKCRFLMTIYTKILEHPRWKTLGKEAIYENVNEALLAILPLMENYPHKPKDLGPLVLHFQVKQFLSECACVIWSTIVNDDPTRYMRITSAARPPKRDIPLDLIMPTMRRLAMLDLVDRNWDQFGDWNAIFQEFQSQGVSPLSKTQADQILQERSSQWKLARNSLACRDHHKMGSAMGFAPQCFRYFPKCTADMCSNIETPKKPHSIRCQKCYYFHCCSSACQRYADMFDQHQCDITPPEKASLIKGETDLYLKKNQIEVKEAKQCHFCSTKKKHLAKNTMSRCSSCQTVWYCSKECQRWDWSSGNHKSECKK
jgi:hypothetical protein